MSNPYSKNKHCKCGKLITNYSIQCKVCANKGQNNPAYKNGLYCRIDKYCNCGKKINYLAKKCKSCARQGIKHKLKTIQKISNSHIGKKHTKKTKLKISKTRIRLGLGKGKNNSMYGRVTHSKGAYYKGIFMRSSWEIAYARYLTKRHIKWQYEPKTFNLGEMTYTPDFYLPRKNLYIEVKGWWRTDAKKKFKLFKKLYPYVKIGVVRKVHTKNHFGWPGKNF
jgi:predicted nuclease of restriction endonuclease-like RecB superfamily